MLNSSFTTYQLLNQVKLLPPQEQLKLAQQILAEVMLTMPKMTQSKPVKRSLLGLWRGFKVTDDDISQARQEMWGNFGERGF
jgi:hypothetical protein